MQKSPSKANKEKQLKNLSEESDDNFAAIIKLAMFDTPTAQNKISEGFY